MLFVSPVRQFQTKTKKKENEGAKVNIACCVSQDMCLEVVSIKTYIMRSVIDKTLLPMHCNTNLIYFKKRKIVYRACYQLNKMQRFKLCYRHGCINIISMYDTFKV